MKKNYKIGFETASNKVPLQNAFEVIPFNSTMTTEKNNVKQVKLRLVLKGKYRPTKDASSSGNQKELTSSAKFPLLEDKECYNTHTQWLSKNSKSILKKQKTLNINNNFNSNNNSNYKDKDRLSNKKDINSKNVHFGSEETPITKIILIEPIKQSDKTQLQEKDKPKEEDTKCQCVIF